MKNALPKAISIALILTGPMATVQAQHALQDTTATGATDSLVVDSVPVDSARLERMALQAELSKEIAAMSRTSLGTETYVWTERGTMETLQGGRTQTQWFWFNPKMKDIPHVWQMQGGAIQDVFFLNPETQRAATLNLTTLQGAFIPARIAEQAGFTGNDTRYASKKSTMWTQSAKDDSTTTWTAKDGDVELRIQVSNEKDPARAEALFNWMRLQPIEPFELPYAAQKHPVVSAVRVADGGRELLRMRCLGWTELESPLEIDATQLAINDPERDLRTIAREWTEEKKAREAAED